MGLDPSQDSALLLQRLGFFTLGVALPVAAMVSRRAGVVLVPIGVALLVIAALLAEPERFLRSLRRRSLKATTLALALLVGWTFLSTIWAPPGQRGLERITNMLFALLLGLVGVAALPERVRAANLNALAVGTGIAAVVAAFPQAAGYSLGDVEDDVTVLVRGVALLTIMAGPLVAWLLLRGRTRGAAALFAAVATTCALTVEPVLLAALAAGIGAFLLVAWRGGGATTILALISVLTVVLAPASPWIAQALFGAFMDTDHGLLAQFDNWASIIRQMPVRLVTGHGFGALASVGTPGLGGGLPASVMVGIWHELGLVGALTLAAALFFAMRSARVLPPVIQAGAMAAYITALVFGLAGLAGFRAWWLMTLVAVVIVTTAVARGQARTDRPLARLVRSGAAPPSEPHRPVLKPQEPGADQP